MKIPNDAIILEIREMELYRGRARARVRYYTDGAEIEETLTGSALDDAIDRAKSKMLEDMPTDPQIH